MASMRLENIHSECLPPVAQSGVAGEVRSPGMRRNLPLSFLKKLFLKKLFLIGRQLLYSVVLASALHQRESAVGKRMSPSP